MTDNKMEYDEIVPPELDYHALNAKLNLVGEDGKLQLEADKEATRQFFLQHVNKNTVFFHDLEEKLEYLVENKYYERGVLEQYSPEFIKNLYKRAYSYKFRFPSFLGAFKYYSSYTLKTFDGTRYLERFEDRVTMVSLYLAEGDEKLATEILDEIMTGRFQPATPTFLNAGKAQRGELISCFPEGTPVETLNGQTPIEKIKVGDQVLSHDGHYHRVEKLIINENSENLISIKHYGHKDPIISTPNHPILVWTSRSVDSLIDGDGADEDKGFVWLEAQDIKAGDYILSTSSIEERQEKVYDFYKVINGRIAFEVANVSETSLIPEKVYNLEVEDTHTYSIHGAIVHNCFLIRVEDNMESIGRSINSSLQLSKRGGGVALNLTNLREMGAPIKHIENQSSGIVPVMKMLEDAFSYANQLGARQGAGAVYLNAHHPDVMQFLDTKRENADEKIRIKTLSLGLVIPDITFELAKNNDDMYLFSPYDVERTYGKAFADISVTEKYHEMVDNPNIRKKKIKARKLFQTIAELQFESGYPYILFEDAANRGNPLEGRVNMSNLCSEIMQINTPSEYNEDGSYKTIGRDISCNLGSLNIAKSFDSPDFEKTVETAIRSLTAVSDLSNIRSVPSIEKGNSKSHAIGLGQMNLHGFLAREHIHYDSPEAVDFTNLYFYAVRYEAIKASNKIARERHEKFDGFENSDYANGKVFEKYIEKDWSVAATPRVRELFDRSNIYLPKPADWQKLAENVAEYGIYNGYLEAVPPTGSISYINYSTSSIHPIAAPIEIRKEGKIGRVYYPQPYLSEDTLPYYRDAYNVGPQAIIDVYAAATQHVDQGLSLTLFYKDTATTRDLNRSYVYAFKNGIKTLYYARIRQRAIDGTQVEGTASEYCESCQL